VLSDNCGLGVLAGGFESIKYRFREIDHRFERIEDAVEGVKAKIGRLGVAFTIHQEFFVEYLASEGVLRPQSAHLLIREANRVINLVMSNPLSPKEKERLKGLAFQRDLNRAKTRKLRA